MEVPKPVMMGYEGKAAQLQASLGDDLWELHGAGSKLLEFSVGRTCEDYERTEMLQVAVGMMLRLMDEAARRIADHSADTTARLSGTTELHRIVCGLDAPHAGGAVWRFVEGVAPELVTSVAGELQRWHEG